MRVNSQSENNIELYLSDEEIEKIFGGYELIDYDSPECRVKLHALLISAAPEMLFPLECDRVLIEVKPKDYGCTIALTKIHTRVKTYRQAKAKTLTLIFENSEYMIRAITALKALSAEKSELYTYEKRYALIIAVRQDDKNTLTHLGEYCKVENRRSYAEKIREYWQPVCKNNAIDKLSAVF